MVSRTLTLLFTTCLLLVSSSLHALSHFSATVSSDQLQYGKSIRLILTATATTPAISNIDLRELEQLFHVDRKADVSIDEQTDQQVWKLRLSPYQVGNVTIPSLYFNQLRSQPIEVNVSEAIDTKTGTPIKVAIQLSEQQPWMRQQVLLSYHLQTQIPRAQLKIAPAKSTNTIIQQLDIHHQTLEQEQASAHHYKTGWAVFPVKAGHVSVTLPPLELVRDGVTTHRFYHPPIELEVKPLPLYIPATIPVGTIALKNKSRHRYLIQNSLADYSFSLSGDNILANNLPEMSNQLSSTGAIRIYPETKQVTQANNHNGISSRIDYHVPFKVTDQGFARLDRVKLSYFDTASGTLKTRFYPNLSAFSINKWFAWVIVIILTSLSAYLVLILIKWLTTVYKKFKLYLQATKQLSNDCSPEQLKASISLLSRADGHTANVTIDRWFASLTGKMTDTENIRNAVRRHLYKERNDKIPRDLREEIRAIAYARAPVLLFLNRLGLI